MLKIKPAAEKYSFAVIYSLWSSYLLSTPSCLSHSPHHSGYAGKRNFFGIRFISYELLDLNRNTRFRTKERLIYSDTCQSFLWTWKIGSRDPLCVKQGVTYNDFSNLIGTVTKFWHKCLYFYHILKRIFFINIFCI